MTNNSNGRKPIFFTSDWHIGHKIVIDLDKRPFKDLDHMSSSLIKNYNAIVPENGVCYFLGDMGFCGSNTLKDIIDQLNGTKLLILGNHDKKHNAMYNAGFDIVLNAAELWIASERVTLSHCPLRGIFREDTTGMRNYIDGEKWHGESRQDKFSVKDAGQFHLHGHIHAGPANSKKKIDGRQFDIGVPGNNYRPIHIKEIESWIAKTKQIENGEL